MTRCPALRQACFGAMLAMGLGGCALAPGGGAAADAASQDAPGRILPNVETVAAQERLPLRLALVMPAELPGGVTRLPKWPGSWVLRKQEDGAVTLMETGLIVEGALRQALGGAMVDLPDALPAAPAPAAVYGATLQIVSVHFDYDEHLRFLLPLPLPGVGSLVGEFEVRTRMGMQLSLLDAQGRQFWTRAYDDGLRTAVWVYPGGYAVRTGEPDWQAGIPQMAQDAATRLAQRVVPDLRQWHEAQRLKPRSF